MSKTSFNYLLFSITFNDKFWRTEVDILHLINTTIEVIISLRKSNLKNTFLLLLAFDQKHYGFSIPEHYFGPLYYLAPIAHMSRIHYDIHPPI